jgi:NAD(P)-dependent dehydrogenase (short-subunit alcohol dehydrogenase family)
MASGVARTSPRFEGKVALVTGGTSGIGEAVVTRFAAEGARVCFTGRRAQLGHAIAARYPAGTVLYVEADHTKAADCKRCVAACVAAFGRLDFLFNNAGVVTLGTVEQTAEQDWDSMFASNVKSVFLMTKAALPLLREAGTTTAAAIVNCASDWALVAAPEAAAYCASKAAVVQLTKCTALGCARQGVRVNAVCPGDTFVQRWLDVARADVLQPGEAADAVDDAEIERRLRDNPDLPMGRVADVHEIASAVLFLCSPESSYITGAVIPVDGGNSAK